MIKIITDSTCDVPQNLIARYNISVLPHHIIWGDDQYLDRVEMQPEAFYTRLAADPVYPSSAHATEVEYLKAYMNAEKEGAEEILVLCISEKMSGAIGAAKAAATYASVPVHIIDGKGPTMSLGWQVLKAARMLEDQASVETITHELAQMRNKLVQYVLMDSLEYLQKGGRIGNATRMLGTFLDIKPLVYIDHHKGIVEPGGVSRVFSRAVNTLYEKFLNALPSHQNLRIAVMHGNSEAHARQLADRVEKELHPVELIIQITGPVLGINTGPGALALCGYPD